MAGIWDRFGLRADDAGISRLPADLLWSGLQMYAASIGGFTPAQIKGVINDWLPASEPLRAEDNSDLDAIITAHDGKANATAKAGYRQHVQAVITAETQNVFSEAQFRAELEIS